MHQWGDENVDWKGIDGACRYIGNYCTKYGRMSCYTKEKWGMVRAYTSMGYLSLHSLIYPGYAFNQFPKWLWNLDCYYITKLLYPFSGLMTRWQIFIYNRAYQGALKRWPHLRAEILVASDYPELIQGASRKEKNTTYILGWSGETLSTRSHFSEEGDDDAS